MKNDAAPLKKNDIITPETTRFNLFFDDCLRNKGTGFMKHFMHLVTQLITGKIITFYNHICKIHLHR